jgi:CelD/BcsL family acetyltransferase involved in cellulose biosynthesis
VAFDNTQSRSVKERKVEECSQPVDRYTILDCEGEQAFHRLREDWEGLWWRSEDATESQTWHWQYLYWKHLAPMTRPVIIVARDSHGSCVALAAFFVCRDQSSWVSKAAFLGDKRSDYHLILARPNLPESVGYRILECFVSKFERHVPFIELSNIPLSSYTGTIVERLFANRVDQRSRTKRWEWQTYAVPLPQTLDDYLKQLGSRSRTAFRYDRRKLFRDFSVDFRVYSTLEKLDEALDAIESVDRARWGSRSRYCLRSQRSFERSVARGLCEMGIYRAFLLYLNGRPSAFVAGAVVRDSLKVPSMGYDRSLPRKLSIGKVTNFYAIEHCIQHGLKQYDLTRGGEEYKKWLGALPSTNLHIRRYRSHLDELTDSSGKNIAAFLRNQNWLRRLYQAAFRR